jgi:neural Wiskott-Aldrich syndrome protein
MTTMIDDELGRIPMSPFLTATLTRAADYATAQAHREVTLEHLLLALAEDPEASIVLKSSNVDIARLLSDVSGFLGRSEDRVAPESSGGVVISQDLKRILEAAAAAAQQGRRREINGAIVLAAIVGDAKSTAAHLLRSQGLTFEAAIRALQRASANQSLGGQSQSAPPASAAGSGPATTDDILAAARGRVQSRSAAARSESIFGNRPAAEEASNAAREAEEAPAPVAPSIEPPQTERGLSSLPHGTPRDQPAAAAPQEQPASRPAPAAPSPAPAPVPAAPAASPQGQPAPDFIPAPASPPPRQWAPEPQLPMPQGVGSGGAAPPPPGMRPTARPPGVGAASGPPPVPPGFPAPMGAPPPGRQPGGPPFAPEPAAQRPPPTAYAPDARMRRQDTPPAERSRPGSGGFVGSWPLIESGQLVENIPRRMRAGIPVVVEARVAKADVKALAEGLQGGGAAYRHEIVVTKAMSVRLRAPDGGFWIETRSPETQWIENVLGLSSDDYASWRWTVTPRERGRKQLQLIVSARTVGADGLTAETALPDQVIDVRVGINLSRTMGRWVGWVAAAVIGGVLARFGEGAFEQGREIIARLTAG